MPLRSCNYFVFRSFLFCLTLLTVLPLLSGITFAQATEQILYSFDGIVKGYEPTSGQFAVDALGNLYGITFLGGKGCKNVTITGCGTVYELSPSNGTWTETVIHDFDFQGGKDGASPSGGLISDSEGNLYGATAQGGTGPCIGYQTTFGCGTIFELTPGSDGRWKETVLYNFQNEDDGSFPMDY